MTGPLTRAFVDSPIVDVDGAAALAAAASKRWGFGPPTLIRRGMNMTYGTDDAVIRVSRPTADPAAALDLADALSERGLAVARPLRGDVVVEGDLAATCWERLVSTGQSVSWDRVGSIVRRLHELSPADLPSSYPQPTPAAFPWWHFEDLLAETEGEIDPAAFAGLERAVDRRSGWQRFDHVVICHGDVHPGNVMMTSSGPVLIDWDLLCRAPAGWDHGPLMTWHERWGGEAGVYEAFAAGYGASLRGDPVAEGIAELRLVAATLMRVKAGRSDPAAAAEAQRRLAYWRGDHDAPAWSAQ